MKPTTVLKNNKSSNPTTFGARQDSKNIELGMINSKIFSAAPYIYHLRLVFFGSSNFDTNRTDRCCGAEKQNSALDAPVHVAVDALHEREQQLFSTPLVLYAAYCVEAVKRGVGTKELKNK